LNEDEDDDEGDGLDSGLGDAIERVDPAVKLTPEPGTKKIHINQEILKGEISLYS
jgi:hypothetical protein